MSGIRIIESMREAATFASGEMPGNAYQAHIPAKVGVKAIREGPGLTQAAFAARLGLSIYALRNWEQGKRRPDPAARACLKVIEKDPEPVRKALAE